MRHKVTSVLANKVLILGAGFVGQRVFAHLQEDPLISPVSVWGTYRNKAPLLNSKNLLHYDAEFEKLSCLFSRICTETRQADKEAVCWKIIVTFPINTAFAAQLESFVEEHSNVEILLFSSASCYDNKVANGLVSENTPLVKGPSRFEHEEALREKCGASVFALSGIFGFGRSPVAWLNKGLIGNADSLVNLVHVSDIVLVTKLWLENSLPSQGQRINISSQTHLWRDLLCTYRKLGLVSENLTLPSKGLSEKSKRVSFQKLLACYPLLTKHTWCSALDKAYLNETPEAF